MNRPGASVRAMGYPPVAFGLLLACAALVAGVYTGDLPGWAVLMALIGASSAVNSLQRMRAYNAWAAEWQAMATGKAPAAAPRRKKNPAQDIAGGIIAVVALPWLASQLSDPRERLIIAVTWLAMCFGLVFLIVRGVVRWVRARRKTDVQKAFAQDEPVAWLIGRASSSPSRKDAMRELPEYSARLLSRS